MARWFVSRHSTTLSWLCATQGEADVIVPHLESVERIQRGDRVYGNLPLHLAFAVCELGAEYWAVSVPVAQEQRGQELADAQIFRDAVVERFMVTRPAEQ
ncbi:CRISPR-associated protein Csx16 [Pokkaliibacter plantistimulans]|uniref:CRISPR-associated protein Csx16 n=1 Tax=Pokkaliibacter plantistimulans TaxID=1635171 RepID=UPI0014022498|nr:CRISPR-associated protein Csx16 [Pokkaliibacter plantistimulans]